MEGPPNTGELPGDGEQPPPGELDTALAHMQKAIDVERDYELKILTERFNYLENLKKVYSTKTVKESGDLRIEEDLRLELLSEIENELDKLSIQTQAVFVYYNRQAQEFDKVMREIIDGGGKLKKDTAEILEESRKFLEEDD